jgi:hypothetical protein
VGSGPTASVPIAGNSAPDRGSWRGSLSRALTARRGHEHDRSEDFTVTVPTPTAILRS